MEMVFLHRERNGLCDNEARACLRIRRGTGNEASISTTWFREGRRAFRPHAGCHASMLQPASGR
jgi:hypothetical protein